MTLRGVVALEQAGSQRLAVTLDGGETFVQTRDGVFVGVVGTCAGCGEGEGDEIDDFLDVIEDGDAVEEVHADVGEDAIVVRSGGKGQFFGLGVADAVVANVTEPAA